MIKLSTAIKIVVSWEILDNPISKAVKKRGGGGDPSTTRRSPVGWFYKGFCCCLLGKQVAFTIRNNGEIDMVRMSDVIGVTH